MLTRPACTTFALMPRRQSSFPRREFTNFIASSPNRTVNLLQPRCGPPVTSMMAEPMASRVPAGWPRWSVPVHVSGKRPFARLGGRLLPSGSLFGRRAEVDLGVGPGRGARLRVPERQGRSRRDVPSRVGPRVPESTSGCSNVPSPSLTEIATPARSRCHPASATRMPVVTFPSRRAVVRDRRSVSAA